MASWQYCCWKVRFLVCLFVKFSYLLSFQDSIFRSRMELSCILLHPLRRIIIVWSIQSQIEPLFTFMPTTHAPRQSIWLKFLFSFTTSEISNRKTSATRGVYKTPIFRNIKWIFSFCERYKIWHWRLLVPGRIQRMKVVYYWCWSSCVWWGTCEIARHFWWPGQRES